MAARRRAPGRTRPRGRRTAADGAGRRDAEQRTASGTRAATRSPDGRGRRTASTLSNHIHDVPSPKQQELPLELDRRHENPGRPKGKHPRMPHEKRKDFASTEPCHVTLRVIPGLQSLRARRRRSGDRERVPAWVRARGDPPRSLLDPGRPCAPDRRARDRDTLARGMKSHRVALRGRRESRAERRTGPRRPLSPTRARERSSRCATRIADPLAERAQHVAERSANCVRPHKEVARSTRTHSYRAHGSKDGARPRPPEIEPRAAHGPARSTLSARLRRRPRPRSTRGRTVAPSTPRAASTLTSHPATLAAALDRHAPPGQPRPSPVIRRPRSAGPAALRPHAPSVITRRSSVISAGSAPLPFSRSSASWMAWRQARRRGRA